MEITNRLFEVLSLKGVNQTQLCAYLEIRASTLSNWKKRDTDPPARYILPICEFLNISVRWLLSGEGTLGQYDFSKPDADIVYDEYSESDVSSWDEIIIANFHRMTKEDKIELINYSASLLKKGVEISFSSKNTEDETSATRETTAG